MKFDIMNQNETISTNEFIINTDMKNLFINLIGQKWQWGSVVLSKQEAILNQNDKINWKQSYIEIRKQFDVENLVRPFNCGMDFYALYTSCEHVIPSNSNIQNIINDIRALKRSLKALLYIIVSREIKAIQQIEGKYINDDDYDTDLIIIEKNGHGIKLNIDVNEIDNQCHIKIDINEIAYSQDKKNPQKMKRWSCDKLRFNFIHFGHGNQISETRFYCLLLCKQALTTVLTKTNIPFENFKFIPQYIVHDFNTLLPDYIIPVKTQILYSAKTYEIHKDKFNQTIKNFKEVGRIKNIDFQCVPYTDKNDFLNKIKQMPTIVLMWRQKEENNVLYTNKQGNTESVTSFRDYMSKQNIYDMDDYNKCVNYNNLDCYSEYKILRFLNNDYSSITQGYIIKSDEETQDLEDDKIPPKIKKIISEIKMKTQLYNIIKGETLHLPYIGDNDIEIKSVLMKKENAFNVHIKLTFIKHDVVNNTGIYNFEFIDKPNLSSKGDALELLEGKTVKTGYASIKIGDFTICNYNCEIPLRAFVSEENEHYIMQVANRVILHQEGKKELQYGEMSKTNTRWFPHISKASLKYVNERQTKDNTKSRLFIEVTDIYAIIYFESTGQCPNEKIKKDTPLMQLKLYRDDTQISFANHLDILEKYLSLISYDDIKINSITKMNILQKFANLLFE